MDSNLCFRVWNSCHINWYDLQNVYNPYILYKPLVISVKLPKSKLEACIKGVIFLMLRYLTTQGHCCASVSGRGAKY